ncbi:putative cobalt transporter subunit (CbtA) [Saccharomonospora marina XMU15]|uniref:Putative cobalt transporter subunit (CbtA) n=1 Tax=Saccharomonospora marina XMU15 TaxID=882083 RepID=H5WXI2_9PSEU|nr:putative cobalt transporter subunit (CbtA) [Saccharomonospora marina XMU15]
MRTLLVRGMLAGLVAGALAAVFAYVFAEPSVEAAIALEESARHHDTGGAAHTHTENAAVSRTVQSTLGLLAGTAGYGVAVGGLFAIAFALLHGRITTLPPRVSAALLAAGTFVVVVLVPFLKYPANPPAVGQAGTIGERTGLYFGFVALSVAAAIVAVVAGRALARRVSATSALLLATAGYLAVTATAAALLPVIDEIPGGFPGATLWEFRVASLGTQLLLWSALGIVFGTLADRVLRVRTPAGQR